MMRWSRVLFFSSCTLFISCSQSQDIGVISSIPVDTLKIVDSIGILYGDSNYIFGAISDIARVVGAGYNVVGAGYNK